MCSVQCASVNSVQCGIAHFAPIAVSQEAEEVGAGVQFVQDGGGGAQVCKCANVLSVHLLQFYRKQERWVQVCSLCKMGEVVHKCTSVQMCTVCTYCSLEGGGDVGVQVCKGGSV